MNWKGVRSRGEADEVLDTLLVVAGSAAGSALVANGERINFAANFFKRAEAVTAGLTLVVGEHTASSSATAYEQACAAIL